MADWIVALPGGADTPTDSSSDEEEDVILLQPQVMSVRSQCAIDQTTVNEVINAASALSLEEKGDSDLISRSEPEATLTQTSSRILVVLDLNGLFFHREYQPSSNSSKDQKKDRERNNNRRGSRDKGGKDDKGKKMGNFIVWDRPYVKPFLTFLFREFDVAVWSSAAKWNVDALVKHTLRKDQQDALKFCWYNDMCTDAGVHPENENKHLYLKELSKVWQKFPEYNAQNTLLIDDSELKASQNPPFTAYHPQPWTKEQADDKQLSPNGLITTMLKQLLKERHQGVPDFIKSLEV